MSSVTNFWGSRTENMSRWSSVVQVIGGAGHRGSLVLQVIGGACHRVIGGAGHSGHRFCMSLGLSTIRAIKGHRRCIIIVTTFIYLHYFYF